MRWPFGPPHLTLELSTKTKNEKKQTKKLKRKKQRQKKKQKNTKVPEKKSFSVISCFSFFGGCPKLPCFDNLAKKVRTNKTL